jgi:predicted transcriptional regulator
MSTPPHAELSRRERQIMDVLHRRGRATVAEIQSEMPDDASYSAIRSALRLLREKEIVTIEHDGKRYIYLPSMSQNEARDSALRYLMRTFFEGSRAGAVSAILEMSGTDLSDGDVERLTSMIKEAKRRKDQ